MAFGTPTDVMTLSEGQTAELFPEIWTTILNEVKFNNPTIVDFVTDLSAYVATDGDTIHVPDLFTNAWSAQTQSAEGAAVVDATKLPVDVTLSVNTHKYVAWVLGDMTVRQLARQIGLNEAYAREARRLLMQEVEDDLFALWSSLSTTAVGDTTTVLSDYEIRAAINTMEGTNFNIDTLAFFFHPTIYWIQLSGVTKYYTDDTSRLNHIKSGGFGELGRNNYKGHLYNIPVYTSTRVVGALQTYRNLLLAPEAFGVAFQTSGGGRFRVQADYLLQNLGTLTVVDCIYGVAVLRADAGVVVNANMSAVAS